MFVVLEWSRGEGAAKGGRTFGPYPEEEARRIGREIRDSATEKDFTCEVRAEADEMHDAHLSGGCGRRACRILMREAEARLALVSKPSEIVLKEFRS